jgi:hypothetical protein
MRSTEEIRYPLDPSETGTMRRIFTFDRVPNKGNAVYRVNLWMRKFLTDNGWEFVGDHRRNNMIIYMRAPMRSGSFSFDVAIPNEQVILRVAEKMIARSADDGHLRKGSYRGSLGKFDVTFAPNGDCTFDHPSNVISAEERHRDHSPTLHVRMSGIWGTCLWWLEGLDQPPTWDRSQYFSALVPGLTSNGRLMSDCEAIHAAELKRYEESQKSRSGRDGTVA